MSEVLIALRTTQRLALEWKSSSSLLAPVVDDSFIEIVRSGSGFLQLGEMLSTYEALETGRFETARALAEAVLERDPARAQAALVLGMILEHVYFDSQAAGRVYFELSKHTKVPQWLIEFAEKLQQSGRKVMDSSGQAQVDAHAGKKGERQFDQLICGILAKTSSASKYEELAKKCANLFQLRERVP